MNKVPYLLAAFLLSSCAQNRTTFIRTDGQDIRSSVALQQQHQIDMEVCRGEAQRASLSAGASFAGIHEEIQRMKSTEAVGNGCMASKGYLNVPEEQAETIRQSFADTQKDRAKVANPR